MPDARAARAAIVIRPATLWVASGPAGRAAAGLEQHRELHRYRPGDPALRATPDHRAADRLGQDGARFSIRGRVAAARCTQGSLMRGAAVGSVLALGIAMTGCTPPPPKAPEAFGLGPALEVVRDEGWLQREIRRIRNSPHLDRAYRMIATGNMQQALAVFSTYLTITTQHLAHS